MTTDLNVSWIAGDQREPVLLGQLPTVQNVAVSTTEADVTVPRNTKRFTIQCRTGVNMQVAYTNGESNTTYFTIKSGTVYIEENINYNSTIHLYAGSSVTAEIVFWQ
jgi:hypothetical protein